MNEEPKKRLVQIYLIPEQVQMIEHLKPFAKTKARTKVLKFALEKAYGIYKDMKP